MNLTVQRYFKLIILALLLFAPPVYAATYYVDDGGSGAGTVGDPWSVTQFNAMSGNYAGDTFYFSGTISETVEVHVYGAGGNYVTLDGYAAGSCDPINSLCSSSASLTVGLYVGATDDYPDYVTIQDFRITHSSTGHAALELLGSSGNFIDYIIIKRNYIYETTNNFLLWQYGNNGLIEGNKFYVFGQGANAVQGVNFRDVDDLVIRQNEIGHNESGYPSDCTSAELIELHGVDRALIEYNYLYGAPNQSQIRPKEGYSGNSDIIIRFNKIVAHSNSEDGIHAHGDPYNDRIYIYGNFIVGGPEAGIKVGDYVEDIYIWSNIITGAGQQGVVTWSSYGNPPIDISIVNNTITRNGTAEAYADRGGVVLKASGGGATNLVKNNLLLNNNLPNSTRKYQFYESLSLTPTLEHNTYYHPSSTDLWYYNSDYRDLTYMQAANFEDDAVAGEVDNTTFTNEEGADENYGTVDDDYTLTGVTSAGEDLSGTIATVTVRVIDYVMDYAVGLSPNTDWTTTPPTIETVYRDDHQWDRGAYVYITGGEAELPVITVVATNSTMNEDDPGDQNGAFTIYCSPSCAGEGIVYTLTGTATIEDDYTVTGGAPGTTSPLAITGASSTVALVVEDDSSPEGEETVILTVSTSASYTRGTPYVATVTINDSDSFTFDYGKNAMRGGILR